MLAALDAAAILIFAAAMIYSVKAGFNAAAAIVSAVSAIVIPLLTMLLLLSAEQNNNKRNKYKLSDRKPYPTALFIFTGGQGELF